MDEVRPKGLPAAMTHSPILRLAELPSFAELMLTTEGLMISATCSNAADNPRAMVTSCPAAELGALWALWASGLACTTVAVGARGECNSATTSAAAPTPAANHLSLGF